MVNEALRKEWSARLKSFARSKQSVSGWCVEHDVPVHQFHYWRRRLADSPSPTPQTVDNWMAVTVVPEPIATPTAPGILRAPGGVTIRAGRSVIEVYPGFDPDLLRAVVKTLESAPC